jgi:hypothetical protein
MRSRQASLVFAVAFGLGWPCSLWGYPDGVTGYSGNPAVNGGKKCSSCHGGGTNPAFSLTGPAKMAPGETQTYVFTITGGPGDTAGLDVSATAGALEAFQSGTKLSSGEITHSSPKSFSGGSASFSFRLKAPSSPGTVTLYGAGVSTNGGGPSGDGTGTTTMSITVESAPPVNQPPIASAGGPYAGTAGEAIQFSSTGSSDPDGQIVSYSWDFGDGSSGTGASPTHAYAAAGSYTASLTVTDDQGLSSADPAQVLVVDGSLSIPLRIAAPGRIRLRQGQQKILKIGVQADLGTLNLPPGETCATLHLLGNGEEVDSVTVCIDIAMEPLTDGDEGDDQAGGLGGTVNLKAALRKGGPSATVRISDSPETGSAAMKGTRLRAVFRPIAMAAGAPSLEWSTYLDIQGTTSDRATRTTLVQVKPEKLR